MNPLTCSACPLLLVLLASATLVSAETAVFDTPKSLNIARLGIDYWETLGNLRPDRSGFSPPYGGNLQRLGYGVHFAYMRRVGRTLGAHTYLGGEFTGYINESDERYAGTDAATGQPVRANLYANGGYFTPCARMMWGRGRNTLHASGGAGLYLLRIKDNLGVGVVETAVHDATIGGYLGLGAGRIVRKGTARIDLEARVHAFNFRHLRPGFPDQHAGGPIIELATGIVWAK